MSTVSEIEIQGNQIVLDEVLAAEVNKWGHRLTGYIVGKQLVIVPAGDTPDDRFPLIARYPGVVGGEPVIVDTRVSVRAIVEYDRLYNDVKRTLQAVPHITPEQIQQALEYYAAHTAEIDEYIAENNRVYEEGANKT